MNIDQLIKAFKAGETEKLPEEYSFLTDPAFKSEIEGLGSKDKLKAAAQVLSDQGGKMSPEEVGKLAGAMKKAGLFGKKKEEGDEEPEGEEGEAEESVEEQAAEEGETPEEEAAEGESPAEEEAEEVPGGHMDEGQEQEVDEEGNPVEPEAEAVPGVMPKGTDDPSIPNESLKEDGVQGDAPALEGTEGLEGEGQAEKILRRALAAIKGLLLSD